ncbi:MAG: type VI secretion system tip protein VgrG [Gammaproteobacteria bacterium]|nr:type VI secretion system tip protein VgrG [Gammaproteobacteria bacterium]
MPFTQDSRLLSLTTPLGANALIPVSFSGAEHISQPFAFTLEMISEDSAIKAKDIIGQAVDVGIRLDDGSQRQFNGIVSRFVAGERHSSGLRSYFAELVPWFQLLTLYNDCRIFQAKNAKAIIEEVFQSRGFSDFEINTTRSFRDREYTVQYRESDFAFVCRLMEEEGIYYFFKHESGKHTMVLGDANSTFSACPEANARYIESGANENHLYDWSQQFELIPGKWVQQDYNFTKPSTNLMTNTSTVVDAPEIKDFEQYDYPGLYAAKGDGDGLTRVRMEEEEAQYNIVTAAGNYRSFCAGGTFTLDEHSIDSETGKSYLITSISHHARDNSFELNQGGGHQYQNSFQCIPDSVVFRPRSVTPKPVVKGPQTALVVGPSGEEIHVDEYGRIKVQFHWDRVGEKNENSSCWLRVSQQWAGKKWGAIFTPRIGHEVIVSFLEGDPDQPIVTGSVYNAENMPPYDLPANKTQSGWKTRSSKDGGTSNYNEIRFEDKKGSEELYIHAEKDQNNVVENDETTEVGNDRTENVAKNETITIGDNRTESVGKNESISIGENRSEDVGKNETVSIGENQTLSVGKNRTVDVGKNETISIGDSQTISVAKDQNEDIGKAVSLTIGDKRTTQVGKDDMLDVGKKYTLVAADEITLKTGKASIVMKKDGTITIKGKDIKIEGTGKINVKASKDVVLKGSKVLAN